MRPKKQRADPDALLAEALVAAEDNVRLLSPRAASRSLLSLSCADCRCGVRQCSRDGSRNHAMKTPLSIGVFSHTTSCAQDGKITALYAGRFVLLSQDELLAALRRVMDDEIVKSVATSRTRFRRSSRTAPPEPSPRPRHRSRGSLGRLPLLSPLQEQPRSRPRSVRASAPTAASASRSPATSVRGAEDDDEKRSCPHVALAETFICKLLMTSCRGTHLR